MRQLLVTTDGRGVRTLTLNRPERHNALNGELIGELIAALDACNSDANVRIVVITGAGASFSSGADLEWMRASVNYDEAANRRDAMQLATLMHTLYDMQKPTIARVNGPSYGGGLGVIACCDIAIAATTAQFAFTEVRLGLAPAVISPYILMSIGPRHARRLFLTAEQFGSREALEFGLVHQVVESEALSGAVEQQIGMLLKTGPEAIKACKRLIPRLSNEEIDGELVALIAALRASPEGQEGLSAFLEKRKPKWIKE
jgi:methylglutaconyl-CoA hydratase